MTNTTGQERALREAAQPFADLLAGSKATAPEYTIDLLICPEGATNPYDWRGKINALRSALSALPQQAATDEGVIEADREAFRSIRLGGDTGPMVSNMLAQGAWDDDPAMVTIRNHRLAFSTPTSQPPAAETRLEEAGRQFARIKDVERALANGAHYADDPECHPCYPTLVAARQILEKLFAALTQPEPTAQQGGEEIMELRDRVQRARDSAGSHFTTLMNQTADQVIAALSAQQAAGEAEAVRELIEMLSPDGPKQDGATVFDHTPEEIGLHVMENHEAIRATLSAPTEPVAFASPGQLAQLADKTEEGGTYIPLRKTSVGNFTMALYATPQPTETQRIVAIIRDVVRSFQDCDGDELAAQIRFRLDAIERGEHLAGDKV